MTKCRSVYLSLTLVIITWITSSVGFGLPSLDNPFDKIKDLQAGKMSVGDFLEGTTERFWNEVPSDYLSNMGSKTLDDLYKSNTKNIPDRIKTEIERLRINRNYSMSDLRNELGKYDTGRGKIMQIINVVPQPEKFTKKNVTDLGNNILMLGPSFLLRITDKEAVKELLKVVEYNYNRASKERKEKLKSLKNDLFEKVNGDPMMWDKDTLNKIDISSLNVYAIKKIDNQAFLEMKSKMISDVANSKDMILRSTVLQKILDAENIATETDTVKVNNFINGLGNMRNDLLPEHIPNSAVRKYKAIKSTLDINVKNAAKEGKITPKTAKILAEDIAKIRNITATDVNEWGALIGYATTTALKQAMKNKAFTSSNLKDILKTYKNQGGQVVKKKMKVFAKVAENLMIDNNRLTFQEFPSEVISEVSPSVLNKLTENDARSILSNLGADKIDGTRTGLLLNKVLGDFKNMNTKALTMISSTNVSDYDTTHLVAITKNLPTTATMVKVLAEKAFPPGTIIRENTISNEPVEVLMSMGAREAQMFETKDIMKTLSKLKEKNANPTMGACNTLKNKFMNYSMENFGAADANDVIKRMLVSDIEMMPVCVIAAFGANALSNLGIDQKVILMERLANLVDAESSITREARLSIVDNGLRVLNSGKRGLQKGNLKLIGNSVFDLSATYLSEASGNLAAELISKMTELIKMKNMLPCLDNDQRKAIGENIKKVKGSDTSKWDTVDDVSCLLGYLQESDLKNIQSDILVSSQCDLISIPVVEEAMEALCAASIGENDYEDMEDMRENLEDVKYEAELELISNMENSKSFRRKRAETSDPCAMIEFGGANVFDDIELESLSFDDIMMCLDDFGGTDMEPNNADILARKIREGLDNDLSKLNASTILDMNFILKGVSGPDLETLPRFTYGDYDDVVGSLAMNDIFTEYQTTILAEKVMREWRSASRMTAVDLYLVKNLICGFDSSSIKDINTDSFKVALPILNDALMNCEMDVLQSFAKLSIRAYNNDLSTWSKVEVAEIGVCVGALMPENLRKLKPEAFEGFSPRAMEIMPSDSLTAMDAEDFRFLPPATAKSISDKKYANLNPEMQRSIDAVLGASVKYTGESGASLNVPVTVLPLLALFSIILSTNNIL